MAMSVVYTTFGGMLIHENRGGTERQYISDPLGSLVGELDSNQNVTYTAEYWPYGEIQTETGTNTSPWSFVGLLGYCKDLASLLYVRARHYLTQKARWLTVDPMWPSEMAYAYAEGRVTSMVDTSGMKPIPPWKVHWFFEKRLRECGLGVDDAHLLALLFQCIAKAESSFKPGASVPGTNEKAFGLFQLGSMQWRGFGCMPPGCDKNIIDPICNMEAALRMFVSMCNDNPDFDPVNSVRGYWGCTRKEGREFYPCLEAMGLTIEGLRKLKCPKKSKNCPGCDNNMGGIKPR